MTNCSLILVVLFLIGLELGDSPLVILSLCSLVLFFVISSLLFSVCCLVFFFFFSLYVCFFLCILCFALCFHEVASWIYIFLTYQKKRSNTFKWSRSGVQTRIEFRLLESQFHIFINIISLCKDSIEFGFEESWFHFLGDRLERFKLKKFFDCLSSFQLPATLRSSSDMKLKLLLGIYTSFLQSLKFNELKLIKCLIEEGSL